jgi:hypothetical protein
MPSRLGADKKFRVCSDPLDDGFKTALCTKITNARAVAGRIGLKLLDNGFEASLCTDGSSYYDPRLRRGHEPND